MKHTLLFFTCLFILNADAAFAQNKHFTTSGTIEYERTANMFALVKKKVTKSTPDAKYYYDEYIKREPQFRKLKSILIFGNNTSLFTPVKPEESVWYNYDSPMANQLNIIYNDFNNGISIIQKEFFERTFLVTDSIRKIKWKITDETRVIAGYTCRRANGLVLDSVYVVAFYTGEIPVSGGPESFAGLPGMILGVAVPHENVTWFATKVTDSTIDSKTLTPPKQGKPVNNQGLYDDIMKVIKSWGDYAIVALKGYLL
ncbi:GLPGLI family protein [Mucilaginibacter pineti]|uniref:GLPGLI family protein n=1 Tax=Mucilaginibacter pineti TaxID=1391627 RepID=A0A1G7DAR2_9SPHI|nr:GLPGLI family protein [Mucilaginibacter pineti]SDE48080.1 GLPGLI family protein [Mucilaginibacter pineti]